jgi:hypothetical protein
MSILPVFPFVQQVFVAAIPISGQNNSYGFIVLAPDARSFFTPKPDFDL